MDLLSLIRQLRQLFSEPDCQAITSALRQDNLIWESLLDDQFFAKTLQNLGTNWENWSPGRIALLKIGILDTDGKTEIDNTQKQKAAGIFQSVLTSQRKPDLCESAYVALALCERKRIKGTWQGLAADLHHRQQETPQPDDLWFTPLACLFSLVTDPLDLAHSLMPSTGTGASFTSTRLVEHMFLSNPIPTTRQAPILGNLLVTQPYQVQTDFLNNLRNSGRTQLARHVAASLLENQQAREAFTKLLIPHTHDKMAASDMLLEDLSVQEIEVFCQAASFHAIAGNQDLALPILTNAWDQCRRIQAQLAAYMAVLAEENEDDVTALHAWREVVNIVPESNLAKLKLAQGLIKAGMNQDALALVPEQEPSPEGKFLFARLAHRSGDFPRARAYIQAAVNQLMADFDNPARSDHFKKHLLIAPEEYARELVELNLPDQAVRVLEKTQLNRGSDAQLAQLFAQVHQANNNLTGAIFQATVAVSLEPQSLSARRLLASLLDSNAEYPLALEEQKQIIKMQPAASNENLIELAAAAHKAGDHNLALQVSQKVIDLQPDNDWAHIIQGDINLSQSSIDEALAHYQQAVDVAPGNPHSWVRLAQAYKNSGDILKAYETLNAAATANPQSALIFQTLGEISLETKTPSETLPILRKANQLDPANAHMACLLGEVLRQLGHIQESQTVLAKAHTANPKDGALAVAFGRTLSQLGEMERALEVLAQCTALEEIDPNACILRAQIILDLRMQKHIDQMTSVSSEPAGEENLEKIITSLCKIKEQDANNFEARICLGELLHEVGKYQDALNEFSSLAEEATTTVSQELAWRIPLGLGKAAMQCNLIDTALAALQETAVLAPQKVNAQRMLADAFSIAMLPMEAMRVAKLALQLAPHDLNNIIWFSRLMLALDMHMEALIALERASQLAPGNVKLLVWQSQTQLQLGDYQAATRTLSLVLSSDNGNSQDFQQVAHLFARLDNLTAAVTCLEKAVKLSAAPSFDLLFDLSSAYEKLGNPSAALDILQSAITSRPEDVRLNLAQADLLAKLNRNQAALACLEQALQTSQRDQAETIDEELTPRIHAKIAQILRLVGDLENALFHARKAYSGLPGELDIKLEVVDLARACLEDNLAQQVVTDLPRLDAKTQASRPLQELWVIRAEMALDQQDLELAAIALNDNAIFDLNSTYRLAVKARLSAMRGDIYAMQQEIKQLVANPENQAAAPDGDTLPALNNFAKCRSVLATARAGLAAYDWQLAQSNCQKAIQLLPLEPLTHWELARCLVMAAENQVQGEIINCETHIAGKVSLNSDHYKLFEEEILTARKLIDSPAIQILYHHGQVVFHPTLAAIEKLVHEGGTALDCAACVSGYFKNQMPERAVKAASRFSENYAVKFQLALGLRKLDPSASRILAEEAISQHPHQPMVYALLAQLTLDDPITARKAIETALGYWGDEPAWHLLAASITERLQDTSASLSHYQQAARLKPDNADYQYELAKALTNSGDNRQAIETFEEAARLGPNQESTWLSLAHAYLREGLFDDALGCTEKACQLNPEGVENRLLYAQTALKMERFEMASDTVKAVLDKNRRHPEAILLMTEVLEYSGKPDQALEFIEKSLANCQATLELRFKRSQLVEQLHGLAKALPHLKELGTDFPNSPDILAHLSMALAETGDYDNAQNTAQTALLLDPDQESLHLLLGRLLRSKGQLDQAIHHLTQAVAHSPRLVEAYLELSQAYKDRREHSQVLKVLRQAIQFAPNDPRPYYQAAMVLREAKDFVSAETMLRHAARLSPEDISTRRQLAAIIALNLVHSTQEAVAAP